MSSQVSHAPELLAPAGSRDCIRAAVENGADAVYFGLQDGFNARARAENMSLETLPEIMQELHLRGVKGYVTLNTLIFTDELPKLQDVVRQLTAAGVDAVLVQDLGLARLIRQLSPELAMHASTQMTLTSGECVRVAEELGIERVVLPRELSIDEIAQVRAKTSIGLEAFVHGALCVAYSGQCLTSESLGGRSANRGQCAQACRLPYDLICDGQDVDLGDQKYLLSPQDLAAYALLPDLLKAGISSFKIEGRLKTPEYVANITKHYREALDAAIAGQKVVKSETDVREMELSFSRGFSTGWLEGNNHKRLVPALSSAKRGVLLGRVVEVMRIGVVVELQAPIARGDGVVFEGDRSANSANPEQGGRVYRIWKDGLDRLHGANSGVVELDFQADKLDLDRIQVGDLVWKTDDPQLTARLRQSFESDDPLRRIPVDITVTARAGQPLEIFAKSLTGAEATVTSPAPLEVARKHPLKYEFLREQLARLGATVFELRGLKATIEGSPMIPLSVLSTVRHQLIAKLNAAAIATRPREVAAEDVLATMRRTGLPARPSEDRTGQETRSTAEPNSTESQATLRVLARSLPQLRCLLDEGVTSLYADFADIRQYVEAVAMARSAKAELFVAPPRIQKPDEMGIFLYLLKCEPDGILVRNLSGLAYFTENKIACVADYSLNATNELTTQFLFEQQAQRVTASYDLNRDQLLNLIKAVPAERMEVVIHQHMPLFHMEHCVYCAVLSPGTNKTNCGRPCDSHVVHLRDRVGMLHPLTADVGCRNTLFNAVPQSSAEVVPTLLVHGVRDYRIELLEDDDADIHRTLGLYRDLLAGQRQGRDVWTELHALNRVGVTRGTLESRRDPLAIL